MIRFLSTPSARRATIADWAGFEIIGNFYPRPPRGGRPASGGQPPAGRNFYPRPPRGGRRGGDIIEPGAFTFLSTPSARRATQVNCTPAPYWLISIHALREEGDVGSAGIGLSIELISIHALRGLLQEISIHALREEGDPGSSPPTGRGNDFYPRPPRGGRRSCQLVLDCVYLFLSTPSSRRAWIEIS